jgi:hypothetical protein
MKNIYLYLIIGLVVVGLGIGLYFSITAGTVSAEAETYVSIAINPAAEFTINENDKVLTAVATDAEGDEIIQSYNFIGMDIDSACEKFTELCALAGYIDVTADEDATDTNDVFITVVNTSSTVQSRIVEKIQTKVGNYFLNNGIFGTISEDLLTEYLDEAIEYGLSVGHIKLIMRALEYNPELTFDELKDLPINEVVALTKEQHKNIVSTTSAIREQLKTDIQALKTSEEYSAMFTLIYEIEDLKNQLKETLALTEEQITALQNSLNEKKQVLMNYTQIYLQNLKPKEMHYSLKLNKILLL